MVRWEKLFFCNVVVDLVFVNFYLGVDMVENFIVIVFLVDSNELDSFIVKNFLIVVI